MSTGGYMIENPHRFQRYPVQQYNNNYNNANYNTNNNNKPPKPKCEKTDGFVPVIVNYLPPTMSEEDVGNLFSCVGALHSCKLMVDPKSGVSKGFAFVNYYTEEDADRAISTYNGLRLQNKTLRVAYSRPGGDEIKAANVYVAGLPNSMTQKDFEELFSTFGRIITSVLLTDVKRDNGIIKGANKGAGLVRFDKRAEAERAVEEMNGKVPKGGTHPITVKFAKLPTEKMKIESPPHVPEGYSMIYGKAPSPLNKLTTRFSPVSMEIPPNTLDGSYAIYVSNLPADTEEARLWKLFAPYGAVLKVTLLVDPATQKNRGVAFINMSNCNEALSAIYALNGITIGETVIRVAFKSAKRPKQYN